MSETTISQSDASKSKAPVAARRFMFGPFTLGIVVAGLTACLIVAVSLISGVGYHLVFYGTIGRISSFLSVGCLVALAYLMPQVYRNELRIEAWLGRRQRWWSYAPTAWIGAFIVLILFAFLTKTSELISRGWGTLFFISGLVLIMVFEAGLVSTLRLLRKAQRIAPRRLMLAGSAHEISNYEMQFRAEEGFEIVSGHVIEPIEDDRDALDDAVSAAASSARQLNVDDVLILCDWHHKAVIAQLMAAFSMTPVAVHVRANGLFPSASMHVDSLGEEATLSLQRRPLSPVEQAIKRLFDLAVAVPALILLSPIFAAIAVLIKLESRGPVFFLQRRRGYNHREFKILKFRTMTSLDDGRVVPQAQRNDPRITRIGHWLRRSNIDELPQLLNVVLGDMSVVGPRPHAVAHDQYYEKRIAAYPRRLNFRPGITGWAQVNGWRGQTETDAKMAGRVEHDLYYIDNWSLGFDLYILVLTVFSRRGYRGAL